MNEKRGKHILVGGKKKKHRHYATAIYTFSLKPLRNPAVNLLLNE